MLANESNKKFVLFVIIRVINLSVLSDESTDGAIVGFLSL